MFGTAAKLLVLCTIWLIFLTVFVGYSTYLWNKAFGRGQVQVDTVTIKSSNDNHATFLLARIDEASRKLSLAELYEINVPVLTNNFGSTEAIKLPENAKLTIQNVDLVPLVSTILNIFPSDRHVVSARPGAALPTTTLQLEWSPPKGEKRFWILRLEPADDVKDGNTVNQEKLNRVLIDRAVYTLLYHMYYDPDGPLEWRKDAKLAEEFPSARALEAYYLGRQYLRGYLRTLDPTLLDRAEQEFRILQEQMPRFSDGLMLLGVTLSEKRSEREAISVYSRIQTAIGLPAANDHASRNMLFQARLFKATAHRKLYTWNELHIAVAELEKLDADLRAELTTITDRQALHDLHKIHAAVLAELASSIGYYLILLYHGNLIEALADPTIPASLRLPDDELTALNTLFVSAAGSPQYTALVAQRDAEYIKQKRRLFKKHQDALAAAEAKLVAVTQLQIPGWDREIGRIVSVLRSAAGYAIFRDAQTRLLPVGDVLGQETDAEIKRSDNEFRARCKEALALLEQADAARPGDYIILQNMGLIYADARFDPTGEYIEIARRLFQRSVNLKPRDYFGHQQLATLAVRQGLLWSPDFADAELINDALRSAKTAQNLRSGGTRIFVLLAELQTLQDAKKSPPDFATGDASFETALAAAVQARASAGWVLEARLQRHVLRLRAAAADQFKDLKAKFDIDVTEATKVASAIPTWEARKLLRTATAFETALQSLRYQDRFSLRWPN